jgi:hypothetical protein
MLDDDPIVAAVEFEGDLDLLDVVEYADSMSTRPYRCRDLASPAQPDHPETPNGKVISKESVFEKGGNSTAYGARTTRRAALWGLAGVSALGIPAIGSITPALSDPVFAAIARHKIAWTELGELGPAIDEVVAIRSSRPVTKFDWDAFERASAKAEHALEQLLATPPVSLEGIRIAIIYILDFDESYLVDLVNPLLRTLLKSPVLAG